VTIHHQHPVAAAAAAAAAHQNQNPRMKKKKKKSNFPKHLAKQMNVSANIARKNTRIGNLWLHMNGHAQKIQTESSTLAASAEDHSHGSQD